MAESSLTTRYDASSVESKWYEAWERAGLFQPEANSNKPVYSITIPPPNVTGSLHMGHALCYPLQDLLGRYKRMTGHSVMILPGQDHAGISTQGVVTRQLRAEGMTPTQIGREKFVERVWKWREESGGIILKQFRALGCAFDWTRERFTLDERYAAAVLKVFVDWFDRGLIYRGMRVVNWDPVLRTSVSDIETERKVVKGKLYHIRYPFADGSGHVTIATTRPETMLADVAVAVHPSDKRYKGLVGKTLTLPLLNRPIPLIEDEYPDPAFGTGAVKITPAHDPNDFEVGQRHNLPMPVLLDESARVTAEGGPYAGLDRNEARKRVIADLEELGLLEKVEDHEIALSVSERTGEVIEPLASEQWFVRQAELAKDAARVVREGKVKFHPQRYEQVYLDWLDNIRDWCISRQLWWGHRIPVYYAEDGTPFAALSWEEAQSKAGEKKIVRQDDDVLDTWFSSGLWPFATLGWPEKTADLDRYYPTDVLVTGRDILYLWVARMVMMGLDFMGREPFKDVYIYATVLTEDGRRMSKSLGTGVDPMEIIESRGADALRYTLFSQTGTNQDIRYSEKRTEEARNFCNKIWNASRFVIMNLDGYTGEQPNNLHTVDRWLLSRLAAAESTVRRAYNEYDIQQATQALYQFFWGEMCDWYIEIAKSRLMDPARRAAPQWTLATCLEAFLKMMHPIMPHITEEVYSHLPLQGKSPFLMQAPWPEGLGAHTSQEDEERVDAWIEFTKGVRALRAELGLAAMKPAPSVCVEGDLLGGEEVLASQAWVGEVVHGRPSGAHISATVRGVDFHLPTEGLIDTEKEAARLDKEVKRLTDELTKIEARLANPMFAERAKPEVVAREREQADELRSALEKARERQSVFGG